jgi:subfamily B ATP-binding cassette protein MsbA
MAMAMALAVPWPLESVLDNVVGNHPAPLWISWLLPALGGDTNSHIAGAAALLTVAIAAITGVAMYAGSYLTESLGQSIGNALRVRLYHHLQTATAWLQARKASALLAPIVTLAIAVCTALVLWRGSLLVLSGVMTIGSLSIFLAYLARFFTPCATWPR